MMKHSSNKKRQFPLSHTSESTTITTAKKKNQNPMKKPKPATKQLRKITKDDLNNENFVEVPLADGGHIMVKLKS